MWDGNDIARELKAVAFGRSANTSHTVNNCLKIPNVLKEYTGLSLQNKETIRVVERVFTFYPYYIIQFNLHDRFKAPDSHIYPMNDRGTYHIDAVTGGITYIRSGTAEGFGEEGAYRQIDVDLEEIPPLKSYKVTQATRFRIEVPEPGKTGRR